MLGHHQGFTQPPPSSLSSSSSTAAAAAAVTLCDCEYESLRLANLCKHYAPITAPQSVPSPSLSSSMTTEGEGQRPATTADNKTATTPGSPAFLSATLTIACDLVQHWGAINGCPNVDSHISAHTLCTMTDAVGLVLRGHELAIEAANKSKSSSHHHHPQSHESAPRAAGTGYQATIGRLELEPSEAAIVAREALKHSIVRLAAMLQDIAEEAALMAQRNSQIDHPLRDRDVRGLTTRLFVTLASVDVDE
ncbi:hypothetical protein FHL15_006285 [Xylaria flabelliformis]|uniref:Aflatoxin regulatory protein domain-containing protein n=1 Tax=Xylaria flabelliformis TaxID=2512241 RepID=A0A553HY66_9PEZI|nr:hypothetical protein FHL15_006285 [Xylaria flabelliformis]